MATIEGDGTSFAVEFAKLPSPDLFTRRAERLDTLAKDNPLSGYLTFLADIARCQAALPEAPPFDQARIVQRRADAMPLVAPDDLGPAFDEALTSLLASLPLTAAPEEARSIMLAMQANKYTTLARAVFGGDYPTDRLGESFFVAAALQAYLVTTARRLSSVALRPVGEGVCPVCGNAPVVSVVVGWARADRARYCCCGLCGTQWNHVRIKCTACGETGQIQYFAIETANAPAISVEACGACKTYIKHVDQHRDPAIEPLCDDIASYGLDILVRNDGFRRAAANPLMVAI